MGERHTETGGTIEEEIQTKRQMEGKGGERERDCYTKREISFGRRGVENLLRERERQRERERERESKEISKMEERRRWRRKLRQR